METFSADVKNYFSLMDSIKTESKRQRDSLKEHKERLKGIKEGLQNYMSDNEINQVEFGDEKLELLRSTRPVPMNKTRLKPVISELFGPDGPAEGLSSDEAFAYIQEHLGSNEVVVLRRSKIRNKKGGTPSLSSAAATTTTPAESLAPPPENGDESDDYADSEEEDE